ncbi:MAG TPA: hypothetical protein VFH50_08060 [Acidimicrobiales bacterium]|nr:hypothetical protein [Acidimicrobiales bacterium]
MRRVILVAALAIGVAACGASDNGGTIPVPNRSGSTSPTVATTSTLPGGG